MADATTYRDDVAGELWDEVLRARRDYERDRKPHRLVVLVANVAAFNEYFTGRRVVQ